VTHADGQVAFPGIEKTPSELVLRQLFAP